MRKIDTIYMRDRLDRSILTSNPNRTCDWVFRGEGQPYVKYDGHPVRYKDGVWWRRGEWRPEIEGKLPPTHWEPCEPAPIGVNRHWPFWVPLAPTGDNSDDYAYWAGIEYFLSHTEPVPGTYEMVGLGINRNPYRLGFIDLWPHTGEPISGLSPNQAHLIEWFSAYDEEGIVWHHPDGRMAKIKRKDLGFKW